MHLTDLTIKGLPFVPIGSKKYWDDAQPGFGVRCTAKSKSFIIMYGVERRLRTIGRYPQISLKEARSEARRLLVHKPTQNGSQRVLEAVAAYLEDCETRLRHNTIREYRRHLGSAPDKPLADLTRHQVDTSSPEAIKTWKVFYNWCIRNELTDKNPFAALTVKYGQRDRVLTDNELRVVWQYDFPPYSTYLKLLILTGQRRGQLTDFQVKDDTLFFPASVMKGKEAHSIPLLPLASRYLERLRPFNGWSKGKSRFDNYAPLPAWTVHDLRRTFSTNMARLGTPLHVTEQILAHRSGTVSGVAAIYNRYDFMRESREALDCYETWLQGVVT